MSVSPVIHWFRRDLRLQDNLALQAALNSGAPVIPVFIFDPTILKSRHSGARRMAFLLRSLMSLELSLRNCGSSLLIRHGDPRNVLYQLVQQTGAQRLYFNHDYSPFARRRDNAITKILPIPVQGFDDAVLLAPGEITKADGSPYTIYTPFMKQWHSLPKADVVPTDLRADLLYHNPLLESHPVPTLAALGFDTVAEIPEADETAAQRQLEAFMLNDIYTYTTDRNLLVTAPLAADRPRGSSYLSPYFRFGLVSPRQAYRASREAYDRAEFKSQRESVTDWVNELVWREFYMHILYHFPHVDKGNFRREYDLLAWRHAPDELQAWKDGLTGYPVVDAAMRHLNQMGWIPNRARMIVASFLTKDLLIHWQEGERHFMEQLIDGDPAANNGGWQWTAGTGTDAQPYFRIFNPISQSRKFDPDGAYIRHWIPELRHIPAPYIHAPWEMDNPPANYPPPIVDHTLARERALLAFQSVKTSKNEI